MKTAIVQLDSAWEDKAANFARVEGLLDEAWPDPGTLVVLPEMFATGFSLESAVTAEETGGLTESFLRGIARRLSVAVCAGLIRRGEDGRLRNESIVLSPAGEVLARYAKQRPFSGAGEDAVHVRGTAPVTLEWGGFTVAPLICYDLRFPELFRKAAGAGANLFVVIAAWPASRIEHWTTLLRARAIENQAAVIGVNRTGKEPQFDYCGHSMVIDCHGNVLADAGTDECVKTAELDPATVRAWRAEFPALRDADLG